MLICDGERSWKLILSYGRCNIFQYFQYPKIVLLQTAVVITDFTVKNCIATLLKRDSKCFPVKFAKFLSTPIFTEHLRWQLLQLENLRIIKKIIRRHERISVIKEFSYQNKFSLVQFIV